MSEHKNSGGTTSHADEEKAQAETGPACDDIKDPYRKTLCKVCSTPVLGELPFCRDHEPPVP